MAIGFWVVTQGITLEIKAAEISFLCMVTVLSLRDLRRALGVELQLHLVMMPPGYFPWEVFQACLSRRKP